MKRASLEELTAERDRLIASFALPGPQSGAPLAPLVAKADRPYLEKHLGSPSKAWEEGIAPLAALGIVELVNRWEDGQRMAVQSDIELLQEVRQSGHDVVRPTPYGTIDAAFPVLLRGTVVHCIWARHWRKHEIASKELREIARVSGAPEVAVKEAVEQCPALHQEDLERLLAVYGRMRDGLEALLSEHVRAGETSSQLVQSERTRALGNLSGGIAHRFNNLLSVILGYASFVLNREEVSEAAAAALKKISEASQRGRRLTEEILAFAGEEIEEAAPCRVHDMLESVLSIFESQSAPRVEIETDLRAEADTVSAPPGSLHQLVYNLLTNAIEGMPEGGELKIATDNRTITENGTPAEYFCLTVTDSGGCLPTLASEAETAHGLGEPMRLKLSRLQGIVGRLDGALTVRTDPGEMTQVEVLMHVTEAPPTEAGSDTKTRRVAAGAVWVVDDDPIFREMCVQVLSAEGHKVTEMTSARAMQARCGKERRPPSLMIIDFSMPECNGHELAVWLREHGCDAPIILVSGFSKKHPDIKKALQIRKVFFLQKPFSFREMTDTLTLALGETLIGD